jgi:hypothetical protein
MSRYESQTEQPEMAIRQGAAMKTAKFAYRKNIPKADRVSIKSSRAISRPFRV